MHPFILKINAYVCGKRRASYIEKENENAQSDSLTFNIYIVFINHLLIR